MVPALLSKQALFSVDATVGSEQIKRAGQAMHESGVPVVCRSDTCVSGNMCPS